MIFDSAGWADASITWTHAAGSAAYVVSGGDVQNAYAIAAALRDWLAGASRPWAASISSVTLTVQDDGAGRLRFVYSFTGSTPTFVSKTPTASWIARFGDTSLATPSSCPSSCSHTSGATAWEHWDTERGDRCRASGWRWDHALLAPRRPIVELYMNQSQAYAFTAALRLASQPRRAYLYDEDRDTWRRVEVGEHELREPDDDYKRLQGRLEVLGVP